MPSKKIDERGLSEMIALEDYDVQATRKEAKAELAGKLQPFIKLLATKGYTLDDIVSCTDISEKEVRELFPDLVFG